MTEFAKEYGEGLYSLAVEENLSTVLLNELSELKTIFRNEPDFLRMLSNKVLPCSDRLSILDQTLRGQVHPYILNFLKILCERGALLEFENCENAFRKQYHHDHQVAVAYVTTRNPLNNEQKTRLMEKLKSMTGREIMLSEKTDPSVLGGILLEIDGKRYDNTIRTRLNEMRQALVQE